MAGEHSPPTPAGLPVAAGPHAAAVWQSLRLPNGWEGESHPFARGPGPLLPWAGLDDAKEPGAPRGHEGGVVNAGQFESPSQWMRALVTGVTAALLAVGTPAFAGTVVCGVGTQVESDASVKPGTIAEIGTTPPHVGWYRVVYDWSPRGEWYPPDTWKFRPVGSKSICTLPSGGGGTGAGAAPAPAPRPQPAKEPAPASQRQATSTARCKAGTKVVDRQQRAGEVLGEDNGMCVVRLKDGGTRSYLAWMLSPEGGAPPGAEGGLTPGRYACSATGAGTFPIEIRDGSKYVDRAGKAGSFSYDAGTSRITFSSGSLAGQYSKLLGSGKFGLSSKETSMFYAVCNLRR